ncbi:putative integral membrane protein [Actinacidiphila reveromycinica]|uniref:Putative integral membrane protein n=1 Tax=Actinacidiphila reveromycinica TaxID=659352 RepID=A0A7U3UN62_9ACTN|nr:DUF5134 domain-containing protein [Streptomyces sp. SN-593]BBA95621.1 putative integral membrane protein [Streptomyces sp. SN-593]
MIAAHGLRWILTVLFGALTVLGAARALRPGRDRARGPESTDAGAALAAARAADGAAPDATACGGREAAADAEVEPDGGAESSGGAEPGGGAGASGVVGRVGAAAPGRPGRAGKPDRLAVSGGAAGERIAHGVHAVMGAAMAVMAWPWGMDVPAAPQAVFFGLAAVWFPATALVREGRLRRGRPEGGAARAYGTPHPWTHAVAHAVMAAAMAWMLLAMPGGMSGGRPEAGGPAAMADMPGMDMSGSGGGMSMHLHGASRVVAGVLAVGFLAMGLWWLSSALDGARALPVRPPTLRTKVPAPAGAAAPARPPGPAPGPAPHGHRPPRPLPLHASVDVGCHGAMALGMAVMLLVLT